MNKFEIDEQIRQRKDREQKPVAAQEERYENSQNFLFSLSVFLFQFLPF
jgi:hypothetical protein